MTTTSARKPTTFTRRLVKHVTAPFWPAPRC